MAGELNTEVRDDPEQCREWVDWFRRATPGTQHIGDVAYRERGESEAFWHGTAGDAARGNVTDHAKDSESVEQVFVALQRHLNTFADAIDTVRSRMQQARQVATQADLIVTPTAILPPGPAPDAGRKRPEGPVNPQAQAQLDQQARTHQAAVDAHQAKQRAFEEASATVDDARAKQADAHHVLDAAVQDPLGRIKTIKSLTVVAVGTTLSTAKARQTAANDLIKSADKVEQTGTRMQQIAADPSTSPASRAAAERAARTSNSGAAAMRAQGEKVGLNLPRWAQRSVEANPGNLMGDAKGLAGLGKGALRGVPVLGTGVAVASGAWDATHGKPLGQAAAETGANIGGGAVGGMAGAEVGGAIGTLICPGVGTVIGGVIGGVAGGTIGSFSAMKGVDDAMGASG